MRKNLLLLGFVMILLQFSCQEEPFVPETFGSVFGEVIVDGSNMVIADVTVSTNPPTSILQTDNQGKFVFEDIKTGVYTLRAEKQGFVTKIESVSVAANHSTSVVIRMVEDTVINSAPSAPFNPTPINDSKELPTNLTLSWEATDADEDDLLYDVVLFNADQTVSTTVIENSPDNFLELTDLDFGTNYFWQVIVKDGVADPVNGDLWSFETVTFPDHRFLFARQENGKYDIYTSDEAGNAIQLTENNSNNWRPRMSPQRDKIAFLSNAGLETHIYLMNRDGSEVMQVTDFPVEGSNLFELDFSWSPDGSQLLYMRGNKLYKINRDGTGTTLFATAPTGFTFAECDWTLIDGKVMARLVGANPYNSTIYLYGSDGNFQQSLLADIPGSTGGGVFSLVADEMLYSHDVSGYEVPDGRQLDARIFLRGLSDPVPDDLSWEKTPGTIDIDPRFSPDGAWIIFTNTNNDGISQKNIYKMNLAGADRTLLFENAEMPEWR